MKAATLLKTKIIKKVMEKVFEEGQKNMEEIQSEVAQEMHQQADVKLEEANEGVRLVIAEFIRDHEAA